MTDSPAVRVPLDPNEQPILDQLLEIRTKLELQRQDKSSYVKSDDILPLYRQVVEQVESLNRIRETKRHEQNRVDTVLDDCFQLISLFYLTLGKNHEPPAIYTIISSTKRLLDHLKEAGFFSPKDLEAIAKTLKDAREIINKGRDGHSASLVTLIEARIEICEVTLHELEEALQQLTPDLRPSYEKLVSVLRSLSGCNTRSKFPTKEVQELDTQLREVEKKLDTGVTEGVTPGTPKEEKLTELYNFYSTHTKAALHPEWNAQQLCTELLNRCVLWEEIIIQKQGKIDERFKELYDKLLFIRNKLEHLQMTHSWSLRETDLYTYQRQLDRVDESRTADGNFVDANGQPADLYAQRTLLYLLRKSYAIIYHLLLSSEPVSEALLPVFNQLTTLRRCLIEVRKHGGVSSPRELYPYSMKLNSIDNMRTDGKFMFGNEVPEGQAAVTALLEECFEIAYELRTEAEEEAEAAAEAAASQAEEQPPQDDNIGDGEMMTKPARPEIPAGV